jgi:oligopeptide transport system substrate-binding protein
MRVRRCAAIVALPVAAVMLIAGCSSGSSSSGSGGSGGSGNANGAITVWGSQPENPLVPSNTNETGGGNVLDSLFTGLVKYNVDTAKPEMAVADSITTNDAQNYDVKLKTGWTFHDGTPVDAASFVDAWNWGAYGPNGALNSSFFEKIKGYDEVNPSAPAGSPKGTKPPAPTAKTMSGLTVVSPSEFKIALSAPFSPFQASLGYTAFSPLPKSFFADTTAFGRKPIGDGPF